MADFRFGTLDVTDVKLGSTQITKVYSGINLVWSSTPADTIDPTVGTLSTVSRTNESTATLTWTAGSDNVAVTGYRIYRSIEGADSGFTLLKTVGAVLTTTDTTIGVFDDIYYYYVTALDAAGNESTASNHVVVAAWTATDIFPSGTPISDNTTEGTSLTIFTSGRFATVVRDTVDFQVGTSSIKFESVGTNTQQYRDSFHAATSGKTYTIRWKAKASQTGKGRLRFDTAVPLTNVDIDATTWTDYETTFTATSTADIRIYYYTVKVGATPDGTEVLWVDDFRIYELD